MFNYFTDAWGIRITKSPGFKNAAALQEYRAARVVFSRYMKLALNRVSFEGVPPTISERVLRESLLWYPLTVFFKVGDSTIALPAVPGGRGWNAYGDFADAYAFAKNGKCFLISTALPGTDDSSFLKKTVAEYPVDAAYQGCIVRCSDDCRPFIETVMLYTEQVADLIRALEVQRTLLKHPIGIGTTQKQRASALKLFHDIDENLPIVLLNQTATGTILNDAQVVSFMQGGDVIKPAMESLDWWENRYFAECGVSNAGSQVDKKGENLTTAELSTTEPVTNAVIQILVDYYNQQLETSGVRKLPGCGHLVCKPGRSVSYETDRVQEVDRREPADMAGDTTRDIGPD